MSECCTCDAKLHEPRLVGNDRRPGRGQDRRAGGRSLALLRARGRAARGGEHPVRRRLRAPLLARGQRAVFHVQSEMERMALEERLVAVALYDRGTIDRLAYWHDPPERYRSELGTSDEAQPARYAAVIHLRTPSVERGYNWQDPVRSESAQEAAARDERILAAWNGHPRRFIVESTDDFLAKLGRVVELIRNEVPPRCRQHDIPELASLPPRP